MVNMKIRNTGKAFANEEDRHEAAGEVGAVFEHVDRTGHRRGALIRRIFAVP